MADSFWGEEKDKIAANQLGLTENYTIFMMANRGEFIPDEDYDAVEEMFSGDLCNADEVVHAVREKEKEVILPGEIHLVGMCPVGKSEPKIYGVVDFSESARLLEDSKALANRSNSWMAGDDTGMSSKAIWAHMNGVVKNYYQHPGDPADLGRCLRLLKLIPEWKPRIFEMSKHSKEWAVLTAHWDELEHMMDQEVGIDWSKAKSAPKTFNRMHELYGI